MSLQSILVLVIIFVLLGVAIGFIANKGLARRLHRQLRQLPGTLQ